MFSREASFSIAGNFPVASIDSKRKSLKLTFTCSIFFLNMARVTVLVKSVTNKSLANYELSIVFPVFNFITLKASSFSLTWLLLANLSELAASSSPSVSVLNLKRCPGLTGERFL